MKPMPEIRQPDVSEIGDLARLDDAIFGDHGYNQLTLRQFYDLAGPLLVVANEGGQLIGYGLALPSATPGEGWFMALGVDAQHRKQGLGRQIAAVVTERATAHGLATLRLTVEPTNHAAIALYERLGFQRESTLDQYFGPGEPRLVMCRHGQQ
jgi:ribosomal-protein-alanine N-acetyltransferase